MKRSSETESESAPYQRRPVLRGTRIRWGRRKPFNYGESIEGRTSVLAPIHKDKITGGTESVTATTKGLQPDSRYISRGKPTLTERILIDFLPRIIKEKTLVGTEHRIHRTGKFTDTLISRTTQRRRIWNR